MQTPYGFEISESCTACKFRREGFFCQIAPFELKDLDRIKSISVCPAGTMLFSQQQSPNGFFVICEGEVKLYFASSQGKTLTLRIAAPGDVIGLWAVLFNAPYEATAKTLRPCQVAFVSSGAFRQYLDKHPAVFQRALRYVGLHYKTACEQLAAVGLGASVIERMAKFLLDWSAARGELKSTVRFALPLSHEEIAEYIGATRESVTRALTELGKRGLIERHGATFVIPNRAALLCAQPRPRATGPQLVCLSSSAGQSRSPEIWRSKWEQHVRKRKGA
jgi:CRP/FNR family transcriptional regulator, cyclic AMP receptor protein